MQDVHLRLVLNMGLQHLPLEFARPIFAYLPLKALIALFATFDRRLQRLLSSPGAIPFLVVSRYRLPAPLMYFLSAVRNVDHLAFANNVQWKPARLSLLSTMNPRQVTISAGLMHKDSLKLLTEYEFCTPSQRLLKAARFLTAGGFPDFEKLTPRLELLTMDTYSMWQDTIKTNNLELISHQRNLARTHRFFEMSFPPSLTSLSLVIPDESFPISLLHSIPINLRSLTLGFTGQMWSCRPPLALLLDRFQLLESLYVDSFPHFSVLTELNISPSLHTMALPLSKDLVGSLNGLTKSNVAMMWLSEIGQSNKLPKENPTTLIIPSEICPPNLTRLIYRSSEESPVVALASIPASLTSLHLHIRTAPYFLNSMHSLKLQSLSLSVFAGSLELVSDTPSEDKPSDFFSLLQPKSLVKLSVKHLPRFLKHLIIIGRLRETMDPILVLDLPPSLRQLRLPALTSELLSSMKTHLPECKVHKAMPKREYDL